MLEVFLTDDVKRGTEIRRRLGIENVVFQKLKKIIKKTPEKQRRVYAGQSP